MSDDDRQVTVCGFCLCASCWQDVHPCEDAHLRMAQPLVVTTLRELDREHPRFWAESAAETETI